MISTSAWREGLTMIIELFRVPPDELTGRRLELYHGILSEALDDRGWQAAVRHVARKWTRPGTLPPPALFLELHQRYGERVRAGAAEQAWERLLGARKVLPGGAIGWRDADVDALGVVARRAYDACGGNAALRAAHAGPLAELQWLRRSFLKAYADEVATSEAAGMRLLEGGRS